MSVKLNPYLSFDGDAKEAMEFYQTIFGGKLDLSYYKEFSPLENPADGDKVMHGQLEGDVSFMGSDMANGMKYEDGARISMSLFGDDEAKIRQYWDRLTEGGRVDQPLAAAPWDDIFGMLTDKFGIVWMLNITPSQA